MKSYYELQYSRQCSMGGMIQEKFHWNLRLCLLTEQINYFLGNHFVIHSIGNIIPILLIWEGCFMERLHILWSALKVEVKSVYLIQIERLIKKKSFLQRGWCNIYLNFRRQAGRHPRVSKRIFWYHIEAFFYTFAMMVIKC